MRGMRNIRRKTSYDKAREILMQADYGIPVSYTHLGIANGFSLEVFFDIADALDVDPADLIRASVFPDQVIGRKEK